MSDDAFSNDDGAIVRPNKWITALAAAPFGLIPIVVTYALVTGIHALLAATFHLTILGLVASLYARYTNPWARREAGMIEADGKGVRFAGELVAPRERIKSALVLPRAGDAAAVRIAQKGLRAPIDVRLDSKAEAERMLHALGLDASQSVASFRVPSSAMTRPVFMVALFALGAVLSIALQPGRGGPPVGILAVLPLLLVPASLRVGADGIAFRWLWQRRFVRYDVIESITTFVDDSFFGRNRWTGVAIHLSSGEVWKIPIASVRGWDADRTALVAERIREAKAQFDRGDAASDAALLRRGERDVSAWLVALRGLGAGANASHREAPVPTERLWRVALDPAASPDARAGAAVALGPTLDAPGRARLRVAAEATVSPKVRIALQRAASEEAADDELAEALAAVDAEVERTERARAS